MSASVSLKAAGLKTSPNQIDLQPGSLTEANNVIIQRNNVIESRRGFKLYGDSFGSTSDRAKQLMEYQERILRHFDSTLQFDTGTTDINGVAQFESFNGVVTEAQEGLRIKSIQANGNLYFTTGDGIKKISATSADQFVTTPGYVTQSGGIKALGFTGRFNYQYGQQSAFFIQDSKVAYRIVWGTKDANTNLVLGTPSPRVVVSNPLMGLLVPDYMRVLYSLDQLAGTGSLISDGDYTNTLGLPASATALELWTNLQSLSSKLDANITYPVATVDAKITSTTTVTVDYASSMATYISPGDSVTLVGFTDPALTQLNNQHYTVDTVAGTQVTLTIQGTATLDPNFVVAVPTVDASLTSPTTVTIDYASPIDTILSPGDAVTLTGFTLNGLTQLNNRNYTVNTASGSVLTLTLVGTPNLDPNVIVNIPSVDAQVVTTTTVTVDYSGTIAPYVSAGSTVTLTGFTDPSLVQLNSRTFTVNTSSGTQLTLTVIGPALATTGVISDAGGITITSAGNVMQDANGVTTRTAGSSIADTNGITNSYNFGVITVPVQPDIPATDAELVALQTYLQTIIFTLQAELAGVIPTPQQDEFISPLTITTSGTVILTIEIPNEVTDAYFFQIYRSNLETATGTTALDNIEPNDELQLVYEAYPTAAELAARSVTVEDIVDDAFKGANLYTNAISGEGILQANEPPPFALDINRFKNYIFFANTRTKHRFTFSLLGVSNMKAGGITAASVANPTVITTDAAHGLSTGDIVYVKVTDSTPVIDGLYQATVTDSTHFTIPVNVTSAGTYGYWTNALISITNGTSSSLYKFIKGKNESTTIYVRDANDVVYGIGNLGGKYFTINSANDLTQYYVWYNTGSDTDPAVSGKVGIEVFIGATDAAAVVATKTRDAVSQYVQDFTTSSSGNTVTITNTAAGYTTDATVGTSQFNSPPFVILKGIGENVANKEVLLSISPSPAIAVDQTAQSLIKVINGNAGDIVYGYYLSGPTDVPGQILLEARVLSANPFYVIANNSITGQEFSPDISPFPTGTLTNAVGFPTIVTFANHGLSNGDQIIIEFSNSTPSLNGLQTIKFIDANHFSVPVNVTVAGTTGVIRKASLAQTSTDDARPNRVYYSKFQQPESVPIVNYLDVGSENKAILRIFPLRDSLFVFKEDGLYRISGEIAPFNLALFDGSCFLIAPDSVDTANNLIYGWTVQGVNIVTESGVSLISRDIDNLILPRASSNYANFQTATWGVGYKSDNSYLVFTVKETTDEVATICFRFSNLTNSWTTFDLSNTCGIVADADDKLYMGAGDTNFIEQERKTFTRLDYSDRELSTELSVGNYQNGGLTLILPSVEGIDVGDVIVQDQTLSIYDYNNLLQKLDLDPGAWNIDVSSISTGTVVTVTTLNPHNLTTGNEILLQNTNTTPLADGVYEVTVIDSTSFTITTPFPLIVAGTMGNVKYSYYNNLQAFAGDDMRVKVTTLASILDQDPGIGFAGFAALVANIGPISITNIAVGDPTVITATAHGLSTGRIIIIGGSNSVPLINSEYAVTVVDANHFSVPVNVTVSGNTGTFNTIVNNPNDIVACFNAIIDQLNLDSNLIFSDYLEIDENTSEEVIIESINIVTKAVTVNQAVPFVVGPLTVFKSIPTSFTYAPITFGDTLGLKHVREATIMFESRAFSDASLNFASDLLPELLEVPFTGDGAGLFGLSKFGSGFFGGASNAAPFRTLVPRDKQRCRYIIMQFTHSVAREKYSIFGMTVTGEVNESSRAYR